MASSNGAEPLAPKQVRALPWPAALRSKDTPLTVTDCYSVGRLIVDNLKWTETRGRQDWSLRRLQSLVLKSASVSTLSRCVRVFRIASELGMRPPWRNLDMRHFVATGSLPSSKRKQLLQKVEREGWSVVKLENHVRECYGTPGRGGRTTVGCMKALDAVERQDLLADLNRLNVFSKPELKKLAKRVEVAEQRFRELRTELSSLGV